MNDHYFDTLEEACYQAADKYNETYKARSRQLGPPMLHRYFHSSFIEKTIRESYEELFNLRNFLLKCDIKIKKPKVLRIRPEAFIEKDNLYISPQIFLFVRNKNIHVKNKFTVDKLDRDNFLKNFYIGRTILSDRVPLKCLEDLYNIFIDGLISKMKKLKTINNREWSQVETNATSIINEHKKKNSKKERKNFQKKLLRLLNNNSSLLNIAPNELFNVMQMAVGNDSLSLLHRFVQRNKADFNIIKKADFPNVYRSAEINEVLNS